LPRPHQRRPQRRSGMMIQPEDESVYSLKAVPRHMMPTSAERTRIPATSIEVESIMLIIQARYEMKNPSLL